MYLVTHDLVLVIAELLHALKLRHKWLELLLSLINNLRRHQNITCNVQQTLSRYCILIKFLQQRQLSNLICWFCYNRIRALQLVQLTARHVIDSMHYHTRIFVNANMFNLQ